MDFEIEEPNERRRGFGRRSSDMHALDARMTTLEDYVHQQFAPGKSIHAFDHDRMREGERSRRTVGLHIMERVLWAALVAIALAAWETARRQ